MAKGRYPALHVIIQALFMRGKVTLSSIDGSTLPVWSLSKLDYEQAKWIRRLAHAIPFYRHLGITLVRTDWGTVELQLRVTKKLVQSTGSAHGGVTAALIDSAVGLALCTMVDPRVLVTTVELSVNYLAPAELGVLKARGRILHKGDRIAVGDGEVRDGHGSLISKGSATYMILGKTRTGNLLPSGES